MNNQPAGLPAAQGVVNPQQSEQLAQAMLANATIAVDPTGQKMGAGIPAGVGGGGIGSALLGAAGGRNVNIQNMQQQAQAATKQRQGVLAGDELFDAMIQAEDSQRSYQRTQYNRFRQGSQAGAIESVYDLVKAPFARKKMQEDRRELYQQQEDFQQRKLQDKYDAEMDARQAYVKNVMPLLKGKFPKMDEKALMATATQMAAQNLSLEKVFPDGVKPPVREEYMGDAGQTMVRFRDSGTGAIMEGENYQPYVKSGPTAKTTGAQSKWMTTYDDDGNEFQTQYGAPDQNGSPQILQQIPTGKNKDTKDFSQMPGESRVKAILASSANQKVSASLPFMFDDNGEFNRVAVQVPNSPEAANYNSYATAAYQVLRAESGAAIPDSEVKSNAKRYIPTFTDSNTMAQKKVQDFNQYLATLHTGYFSGYDNVPEELGFVEGNKPWADTAPAQQAEQVREVENFNPNDYFIGEDGEWYRR